MARWKSGNGKRLFIRTTFKSNAQITNAELCSQSSLPLHSFGEVTWPAVAPGRNRQSAGAVGRSTGQPPNPAPLPHRRRAGQQSGQGVFTTESSYDAVSDISVVNSCFCDCRAAVGSGAGWCGWFAVWSTARLPIIAWGDGWSPDFTDPVPGSVRHVNRFAFHAVSAHRRRGVDVWGVGISVGNRGVGGSNPGSVLICSIQFD